MLVNVYTNYLIIKKQTCASDKSFSFGFGLQQRIRCLFGLLFGQMLGFGCLVCGQFLNVLLLAVEKTGGFVAKALKRCCVKLWLFENVICHL